MRQRRKKPEKTVLLKDLDPRKEVKGGSRKVVFGESTVNLPYGSGKRTGGDKR